METKKILLPMIVAITTLVVLTFGATYAYFSVSSTSNVSATASATAPSVGSVSLASGSNLSLSLTRVQMMQKSADTPYTSSGNIATATVTGDGTFSCSYTLNVAYSGTMKAKLANTGWAVLTVNGTAYDIQSTTFPLTVTGNLTGLTKSASKSIAAEIKVVNLKGTNQNAMAGTNATFTFTATAFSCSATA